MTVSKTLLQTRTLQTGVVWREYRVTVTHGPMSQAAKVQLTTMPAGTTPHLLTAKVGQLATTHDMLVHQFPHAVAAINGGFFYGYRFNSGGWAYLQRDASVAHGQVVRAGGPATVDVGVDTAGRPYTGTLRVSGSIRDVSTAGAGIPIQGVNWQSVPAGGAVEFTPAWAAGVPRPVGSVEWVVKGSTVSAVETGRQTGGSVAAGTKVIAFGSSVASRARQAHAGDTVSLAVKQVTQTGVPLRDSLGRGRLMVSGGTVALGCTQPSSEPRPRTTLGWTSQKQWMSLVVPGTGYSYGYRVGGLSITAEANVAKALGFSTAIELDGGGSVTSYLRGANGWQRVDNPTPSMTWERPVANGLAFSR